MREVVTAFIEDPSGKFLVMRRSALVRTYPGAWGALSGSIDPGANSAGQVFQELEEETGLSATLMHQAEPFSLCDPEVGTFRVHPFLLRCEHPEALRLNPENDEARWVERLPQEEDVVPALGESLRRARGGQRAWLSSTLREALLSWRDDRARGASTLAVEGARLLAAAIQEYPGEHREARVCICRGLAMQMQEAHPDMAIIPKALGQVLRGLREDGLTGAKLAGHHVEERLVSARQEAGHRGAIALSLKNPDSTWLTLSASTAVREAILAFPKRDGFSLRVRVLESRPLGEGSKFAKELHEQRISVTLFPDLALLEALRGCSAVLLGADAVFDNGAVRNKVGSALVAMAARQHNIPVYAIAEAWKVTRERAERANMVPPEKAVPEAPQLTPWVPLFEEVPAAWIDSIYSEEGPLDQKRLAKLSERRSMWSKRPYLVWRSNFEEP